MEIGAAGLMRLADMVCGNTPFDYFPYRSSSYLTRFFVDLDLDYFHNGSTRSTWVHDVLKELNAKPAKQPNLPSPEITKVIEYLLHPDHFLALEKLDKGKAIETVKTCLKPYNLSVIEASNGSVKVCPQQGEFISTSHDEIPMDRLIIFKPSVFNVPNKLQNEQLISVMMPFNPGFDGTFKAIKEVTDYMKLECLRADSIWDNTVFIQDIFELIYCAKAVIVDFTGRNPNVMYETGIAHTLGKTVIPITQSLDDIPSDLGHHRALKYLPNQEGYKALCKELWKRLKIVCQTP